MRYTNLNPALTTDILEKAGFQFDGYYYVRPGTLVRFNQEEGGFKPSFEDASLPRFDKCITTYCELVILLHGMLQMHVQMNLMGKNFTDENEARKFIVKLVHDYYSFDPDIKFVFQFAKGGFLNIPNDEYTFSIIDGNIGKFTARYKVGEETKEVNFECAPQCICIDYVKAIIKDANNEDVDDLDVFINTSKGPMKFIGMGIPKLVVSNGTPEETKA